MHTTALTCRASQPAGPARLPDPGTRCQPILIRQHDHAQHQNNLICIIAPVSAKHP